jgi:hypothetical protein
VILLVIADCSPGLRSQDSVDRSAVIAGTCESSL